MLIFQFYHTGHVICGAAHINQINKFKVNNTVTKNRIFKSLYLYYFIKMQKNKTMRLQRQIYP